MRKLAAAALLPPILAAVLTACTTTPAPPGSGTSVNDQVEREAPHLDNAQIHADLIQQMLDKNQYYAALAHIEDARRSGGGGDQLNLLEAEARSRLGQRSQAEALYRGLLEGAYSAPAYHGLGLLYTDSDLDYAIRNLRTAVERAPTNVDFRNDLGYALMEAGRYTEAMPQLSTAAELAPAQVKSRNNLIILMLLVGNEPSAQRLAQESGAVERMPQLRDSVRAIRARQQARAAKPANESKEAAKPPAKK